MESRIEEMNKMLWKLDKFLNRKRKYGEECGNKG